MINPLHGVVWDKPAHPQSEHWEPAKVKTWATKWGVHCETELDTNQMPTTSQEKSVRLGKGECQIQPKVLRGSCSKQLKLSTTSFSPALL